MLKSCVVCTYMTNSCLIVGCLDFKTSTCCIILTTKIDLKNAHYLVSMGISEKKKVIQILLLWSSTC